jgi:hypothetical protein
MESIGLRYGCSKAAVHARLKRAGVEIRSAGRHKVVLPMDEIISDYKSGMGIVSIGVKYGCSGGVVHTRLRRAGVEMRSTGPIKKTGNI